MPVVGQTVPHRNTGQSSKLVNVCLLGATELNAVVEAAENASGVGDGFLVAHLGAGGIQVGDVCALVVCRNLEGAAGTGRGLLEDQRDVLVDEVLNLAAGLLCGLQFGRQIEKVEPLFNGEVGFLQEVTSVQGELHCCFLSESFVVFFRVEGRPLRPLHARPGTTCSAGRHGLGQARRLGQ